MVLSLGFYCVNIICSDKKGIFEKKKKKGKRKKKKRDTKLGKGVDRLSFEM